MTMGFGNAEVICDSEKGTFPGEVKANSLSRMHSRENVRTGGGLTDNSRSPVIKRSREGWW